jgi:recombination protein RecA
MATQRKTLQAPPATKRAKLAVVAAPTPRAKLAPVTDTANSYFASSEQRTGLEFISSGCKLLDQVLGGGYVLGRMSNIIGDKSTGKTLLAIEAAANFIRTYPGGYIRYVEAESAFDPLYASALGMPVDQVDFAKLEDDKGVADRTVEWVFEDIQDVLKRLNGRPGLYVIDSLDALSDREEMKRDISAGTYGGGKPKKIGELFRRLVGDIEQSRLCILIISQIRDKIGVTFGETKMRAGGRAMDFYATHCLWLAHIGMVKKTMGGVERAIGVEIRAKCKKNKVGLPFRECDFELLFGWGVDDIGASIEWLIKHKREERLKELDMSKSGYKTLLLKMRDAGGPDLQALRVKLDTIVVEEWSNLEQLFLPKSTKY